MNHPQALPPFSMERTSPAGTVCSSVSPESIAALTPEQRAQKKADDTADAKKHWSVENGELVNDGNGAYLTTDKDYGDIELLIEYKTVPKADSGIYLRGTPQVQIWDYTDQEKFPLGANKGSGGLWNNSRGRAGKDPLVLADKPFGEWNQFRIRQVGARTTVHLNGKLVVDNAIMENYWNRSRPLYPQGPIQLQTHGGEIRWRNIFVREIPPEEANQILHERDHEGFTSLFNGKDLTGWQGAVDNYEVTRRWRHSLPSRTKVEHSTRSDQYDDFVVKLEVKLPKAGNNGLAIRYPGKGDPAYAGMTELAGSRYPRLPSTARPASGVRFGLRHGPRRDRLPAPGGPMELSGSHRERLDHQSRTQRHRHPGYRSGQCHPVHGQPSASRQRPEERLLRIRWPQRSGRIPRHLDQTST